MVGVQCAMHTVQCAWTRKKVFRNFEWQICDLKIAVNAAGTIFPQQKYLFSFLWKLFQSIGRKMLHFRSFNEQIRCMNMIEFIWFGIFWKSSVLNADLEQRFASCTSKHFGYLKLFHIQIRSISSIHIQNDGVHFRMWRNCEDLGSQFQYFIHIPSIVCHQTSMFTVQSGQNKRFGLCEKVIIVILVEKTKSVSLMDHCDNIKVNSFLRYFHIVNLVSSLI